MKEEGRRCEDSMFACGLQGFSCRIIVGGGRFRKPFPEHAAADKEEKAQGDPGDGPLKDPEILHDGVDAEPAGHRHEKLEKGEGAGNECHAPARHPGLPEAADAGYGKGIHGKADSQQNAVYDEKKCLCHNFSIGCKVRETSRV